MKPLLSVVGNRRVADHRSRPFLYRPSTIRLLFLCSLAVSLNYLVWRGSSSLNPAALVFSVAVLLAEVFGVVNSALFAFMTWETGKRFPFDLQSGLSVDVFVPTYDEDVDMLEATLIGCQLMSYPHTTFVLDDGRRPAVRELAQRHGCQYLTRPSNRHAKAGNLNAALLQTRGEFIAVLDADTVPQPDLLDKTLGYFVDLRVALVQLPQEFYNVDSIQHSGRELDGEAWHEQQLFYRVIQAGKNRWNAAFWCGSPSVLRRAALLDIGGVATETVTEDLHTTVRLHARGWKTVFHNEVLAFGMAPQTLLAFTLQRLRWAQGTMQLLRSRENPLVLRGLSTAQRLNYLGSMASYFDPYQKLVFLLTPPLVLVTGVFPFQASAGTFLLHWVPAFLFAGFANLALGRGYFHPIEVDRYNFLKMFVFLRAWVTLLFPGALRFRVTPKRVTDGTAGQERWLVLPHLFVLGLVVVSLVIGVANVPWHLTARYSEPSTIVAVVFWGLVNAGLLGLAVTGVLTRRHSRRDYRFPLHLDGELRLETSRVPVVVENVSPSGIGMTSGQPVAPNDDCAIALRLHDGTLQLAARVTYCRKAAHGGYELGVELLALSDAARRRWTTFLFVRLPRLQMPEEERSVA